MPSVVLWNVGWDTYSNLLRDLADASAPRLTFDGGELEITSFSLLHEELNRTLSLIVEIVAVDLDVHIDALGSTTFQRQDIARGFDPDSCFYVKSAEPFRGKKRADLSIDSPPDLVIEIDITTSSIPKMPIYAQFGVPEVWQYDGNSLRMSKLQGDKYTRIDRSLAFPILTPRVLEDFLARSQEWEDHPRLARFIRDWVAANR